MANKEATARIKINKLLEAAGWRFFADGIASPNIRLEPSVTIKSSDLDALGDDFEKTSKGFIDFLLLDTKGFPLIVLEAKREDKNPLVGCSGTMGKVAIVPKNAPAGVINQALLKLTPTDQALGIFLKLWMESENFQQSLADLTYGAAIKNVASVEILKGLRLPLPPLATQQAIVAEIEAEQALVAANRELIARFEKKIQATLARVWGEEKGEG